MAKYLCKNFGDCGKADGKEEIEIPTGTDPICPECNLKLYLTTGSDGHDGARGAGRGLMYAAISLVVIAAGVGGWLYVARDQPPRMVASPSVASSAPASGVAPNEQDLDKTKQAVDAGIRAGSTASSVAAQRSVIARELVKAAIPLMQAGKWQEADAQLAKAKAEDPDEPLVYVNQAIVQLKQSRLKESIALIDQAFQKGFRDLALLERDTDLKLLVATPEYKSLAARYKK